MRAWDWPPAICPSSRTTPTLHAAARFDPQHREHHFDNHFSTTIIFIILPNFAWSVSQRWHEPNDTNFAPSRPNHAILQPIPNNRSSWSRSVPASCPCRRNLAVGGGRVYLDLTSRPASHVLGSCSTSSCADAAALFPKLHSSSHYFSLRYFCVRKC